MGVNYGFSYINGYSRMDFSDAGVEQSGLQNDITVIMYTYTLH